MNHLNQIRQKVADYKINGMLLTSASSIFYALGIAMEGTVLVTPSLCSITTDGRYFETVEAHIQDEKLEDIQLSRTQGRDTHLSLSRNFILANGLRELGFEGEQLSLTSYRRYDQELPCTLIDTQVILTDLRGVKTLEEQQNMKAAQKIAETAFTETLNFIKVGRTEQEIAAFLTYEMAKRGGLEPSFSLIVASGPNSSRPHAVPTDRQIQTGEFVTIDFGCKYKGYCSDTTRTVAVGTVTDEMKKVYNLTLKAQKTALSQIKAGQTGGEMDKFARDVICEAGYGEYFTHSLGHSVGIEVHERPNLWSGELNQLPVGVVCSVEPGIYIAGKFGVRIEDVVILTAEGCENITTLPKELLEL